MSAPHYITSRAELRKILEDVHLNKLPIDEAYGHIDLTIREAHLGLADWLDEQSKKIRDSAKAE